ncbi:myosin-11 [Ictalurus furcatus]|uniref:myosin-11 n=1 Tax=Ictalurus furcatus TaxID=66913 RepID=UPI00234FE124|nr:myosin-11 [Ictalurus furcatus]
MAWIQLLLFSCLSLTPLTTLSHSVPGDVPGDHESPLTSICDGIYTELSNCNQRLLEKTEYSFNIEKDLFLLKDQLRVIRVSCLNASQASSLQIAALQNQLDRFLKQLTNKTAGPAEVVLNILQEYVEVQKLELSLVTETDPRKIAEMKNQLKKARADLETLNGNLGKLECQTANSQNIVKPVIRLQDEIVELYRRQVLLLNTHTQFTAVQRQLEKKKSLLSDLQEEKEKGDDRTINEQIDAVEQELSELQGQLDNLTMTLSQKPKLEKELQEKRTQLEDKLEQLKNDSQELISQILSLQLELRVRQVEVQGEITDVEKELSEKSERIAQLLGRNQFLEKKLADTQAECNDLQENFNELLNKVEDLTGKLPDLNLKQILDIVSLNMGINNLEDRIRSETSESKRTELEKELREKKEQLESKKKELLTNDDLNTRIILTILSKLEEMRKLQSQILDGDSLDQIKEKKEEVLGLLSELDDSNLAKTVLKNLVLLSDETHLKKLISNIKQKADKQIAELQEEVRKKEEELKRKTTELGKKDSDIATLTKEIRDLREELKNLTKQVRDVENTSASRLRELEKQLKETRQELEEGNKALQEKDADLAKKVIKITELLEELRQTKEEANRRNQEAANRITDLEGKLKKQEEENKRLQGALTEATECDDLKKSNDELKAEFQDTVSKLNDTLLHQVFTIQTLTQDVKLLEDKFNSSEGNFDELNQKLQEKKAELEEAKNKIQQWKAESLKFLKLLEELRKVNRKQQEHIQEYLAQIKRLEKDMEEMLAQLSATGNEKSKLAIQVIFLKEEVSQLNKGLAGLKKEHQEKTAGLEEEIEEKNKEIAYLKRSGCENQISDLQRELRAKQKKMEQLKRENAAQIGELEKHLVEKNRKLEESREELKERDSQNAGLIERLADLSEQLNTVAEDNEQDKQTTKKRISELEEQLKKKERELSELNSNNSDLEEQLEQKEKELSNLKNNNTDVIDENERLRDDVTRLNERVDELQNVIDENERLRDLVTRLNEQVKELEKQPVTAKPPKDITVFSLEFDPQTAHRRFHISTDGRTASGAEIARDVRDNPERYDTAIAALTKTGFTSGRCYWEVQVKDRSCFVVGIAAETAPRKGEIKYKPNNGYWTILRKKDGRHQAQTERPITLRFSDNLSVIGVLTDFTKGEVTFYNAQTRALIYNFRENNFTEKLYPYVGTCTDENPHESAIELLQTRPPLWLKE